MAFQITPIMYLNSDKTVRLSCDELQWILEKGKPTGQKPGSDSGFRGQSYIRSNKRVLLRCIREKHLQVDLIGRRRLAVLPDTYKEFSEKLKASGSALLFARLDRDSHTAIPLPERSVVSKAARFRRIRNWQGGKTPLTTAGASITRTLTCRAP